MPDQDQISPTPFQQLLMNIDVYSRLANVIALGSKLKLFDALAAVGSPEKPASPKDVADRAACKERYVKEWLGAMACGNIIEVTEDEKFFISPENVQFLNTNNTSITQPSMNIALLEPYPKLLEVIRKDGPSGLSYENYSRFYEEMASVSESMHRAHLFSDFIPLLGVEDKLETGGLKILDVGCGAGFHAALLAERYPNCHFTGIDLSEKAIEEAKNRRRESDGRTFTNLDFLVVDAGKMLPEWSEHFDLALIFDSCHDQTRPDLCLKEIHRVLKADGRFGMIELKGTSSIYKDKQMHGPMSVFTYSASLFHCLPVASNGPDALGLGAAWGQVTAETMLRQAGFSKIDIVETPFFYFNEYKNATDLIQKILTNESEFFFRDALHR